MKIATRAATALLLALALVAPAAAAAQADDAPTAETTTEAPAVVDEPAAPVEAVAPVADEPAPAPQDAQEPAVAPESAPAAQSEPEPVLAPESATQPAVAARTAPADVDYQLALWKINATDPDIWPGQTLADSLWLEDPSLDALDNSEALTCGTRYQVDLYLDDETTTALLAGGVLNGPNNPAEHLANGAVQGNPWKYLTTEPCPVVTNACEPGQGDTSTDLNDLWANVDTRSAGHLAYVPGALHIWTDDSSSQAKVSEGRALSFPLRNTGTVGINATAGPDNAYPYGPGVNLFVTFAPGLSGTLVYEGVYGQDLWLTNGSNAAVKAAAPSHTGGNGSDNHGTIDQWLAVYPDAQVTGVAYSLGSGVHGDWFLESIQVNCATYTFDQVEQPELTPPLIVVTQTDWNGSPVCGETSFTQTATETTTTTTYRVEVQDGGYVILANEPTSSTADLERVVNVDAFPCPTETPTETPSATPTPTDTATPVVVVHTVTAAPTGDLAHTGANGTAVLGISALLLVLFGALGAAAHRARRSS